MKQLILIALGTLTSFSAFADGIPVPMERQTKYNWVCANDIRLHLFAKGRGESQATLYFDNGGQVGAQMNDLIASHLIAKN